MTVVATNGPVRAALLIALCCVVALAGTALAAGPSQVEGPAPEDPQPAENPCIGPDAGRLRCPDLVMRRPWGIYSDRVTKPGRTLLRAGNAIDSIGAGPAELFGTRIGPRFMRARQRIYTRDGGRIEVDPDVAAATRGHLLRIFPALEGRAITHAWGGPIDVSPSHIPQVGTLPGAPVHFAFGFTGNGVGPTHLAGRALASLALDRRDRWTALAIVDSDAGAWVPPEPLAWLGGNVVRQAFLRREEALERGEQPDLLTRAACAVPKALGIHVAR